MDKYKDPAERLINGEDDLRSGYQQKIPASKLKRGSLKGKVCIPLSDGKTWIFVKRGKNLKKIKEKYEQLIKMIYES